MEVIFGYSLWWIGVAEQSFHPFFLHLHSRRYFLPSLFLLCRVLACLDFFTHACTSASLHVSNPLLLSRTYLCCPSLFLSPSLLSPSLSLPLTLPFFNCMQFTIKTYPVFELISFNLLQKSSPSLSSIACN